MRSDSWDSLQQTFSRAVELQGSERAAYLDDACRDRPELRDQVEALLAAHERSSVFLDSADIDEAETTLPESPDPNSPHDAHTPHETPTIPGFRIIRELGRGGMGIVYEAERLHPRQTVALKLLKPSFAQPSLRRRFEHEIHLLARLQHPGIAQIYDAGVTPSPLGPIPYFAMELVKGRPLDEVARDESIPLRTRLELVAKIADAVQHAHQRAVIHRDLKPSNIIITPEGQPKILDFGVARALDPDLQLTTMQTQIGQLIGTLPYMSPEQAVGDLDRLDTRSDVYSLGVVAYELLAGRPPYDLANKLIPEAVHVIAHEEPTHLSTIDRACRGDIETIVAKALEKNRDRRYQSVADFAADIRRYLSDEPIVARPPSRVYLVRKFAKRHRSLVVSSAVVLVLLVAGVTVATTLALRLARANNSLTESVDDLRLARDDAQHQADTARAVNEFYTTHLLLAAAPEASFGRDITIKEALNDASARVDTDLADFPAAAGFVHHSLSSVFRRLDMPALALKHGADAIETYKAALGDSHKETLYATINYAQLLHDSGRFDESEPMRTKTLATMRETLGDEHPYTLTAMTGKATVSLGTGEPELAIPLLERVIEVRVRQYTEPDVGAAEDLINARMALAQAYDMSGRSLDAETTLRQALDEARAVLDPDHPFLMGAMNGLGAILLGKGDFEAALPIIEATSAAAARVLGPEHTNALITRSNLARTLSALDRFEEAELHWIEIIPLLRERLPNPHPLLASIIQSYGIALAEHDRGEDAIPYLIEAHTQYGASVGTDYPEAQRCARWLVSIYEAASDEPAAAEWRKHLGG